MSGSNVNARPRRGARALLAAALAALVVAVTLAAPGIPAAEAATGTRITSTASGRCLDVTGNVSTAGTVVNLYDCNNQANQSWTFSTASELKTFGDTRCLDVASHVTTSPARAQIYTCNSGANQQWRLNADGTIRGVESGLCLSPTGGGSANGTVVIMLTCSGAASQKWTTTLRPDTTPPSIPKNPRVTALTCDSATFAWNASTDAVGVTFYDVYHDGQLMTSVAAPALTADLTVVGGVTWGLYVNARDAAGNVSQASTTVPITPPNCQPDTQRPSPPKAITPSVSGTTITLT